LQRLKEAYNLHKIPDMSDYIRTLREERAQAICMQTLDSIGVVPLVGSQHRSPAQPLSIDWDDEQELKLLFQEASIETKLAVIRDAQHKKRLFDDKRMLRRCKRLLSELELHDELYNLMELAN